MANTSTPRLHDLRNATSDCLKTLPLRGSDIHERGGRGAFPLSAALARVPVMLALTLAASLWLYSAPTTAAAPARPASGICCNFDGDLVGYEHSWYMTDLSSNSITALAGNDAVLATEHCNAGIPKMFIVLDFGQPGTPGGGSTQYGTFLVDAPGGYPWVSDSSITSALENYMDVLYNDTSSCPRRTVAIGTNNSNECPFDWNAQCNVSTAGQQRATVVNTVEQYTVNNGYSWQITVWGGDDMETSWDHFATSGYRNTKDFIDRYNGAVTCCFFADFGDAWIGQDWSDANIHYKAWGGRTDVPLPEIYWYPASDESAARWEQMANNTTSLGTIYFYGVMTECPEGDELPSTSCTVGGSSEWAPNGAWSQLKSDLQNYGLPLESYTYETNIQCQTSGCH